MLVSHKTRNGAWPSGKAAGFGPVTRRFESFRPRLFWIVLRTRQKFIKENNDIL